MAKFCACNSVAAKWHHHIQPVAYSLHNCRDAKTSK